MKFKHKKHKLPATGFPRKHNCILLIINDEIPHFKTHVVILCTRKTANKYNIILQEIILM